MTNSELKEFIELHTESIRDKIESGNDLIHEELKQVNEHLERQNNSISKLKSKDEAINKELEEIRNDTGLVRWIRHNPFKTIGVLMFLIIIIPIIVDIFGFENLIKLIH